MLGTDIINGRFVSIRKGRRHEKWFSSSYAVRCPLIYTKVWMQLVRMWSGGRYMDFLFIILFSSLGILFISVRIANANLCLLLCLGRGTTEADFGSQQHRNIAGGPSKFTSTVGAKC